MERRQLDSRTFEDPHATDLATLAESIRREVHAAGAAARAAVDHAVRAGELLIQAKAALPHGMWGGWVRDNCVMSDRTARAYMQLARRLAALPDQDRQRVADLPLRKALTEIAEPRRRPSPFDELLDHAKHGHERLMAIRERADQILSDLTLENAHQALEEGKQLQLEAAALSASMQVLDEFSAWTVRECDRKLRDLGSPL